MTPTKKWWQSKTVWIAGAAILTTVGAILSGEISLLQGVIAILLEVEILCGRLGVGSVIRKITDATE